MDRLADDVIERLKMCQNKGSHPKNLTELTQNRHSERTHCFGKFNRN